MRNANRTNQSLDRFFERQQPLMRPQDVATLMNVSIKTIYDWKYRAEEKRVPRDLFVKFNNKLYIQTEVLKEWFTSQNERLVVNR